MRRLTLSWESGTWMATTSARRLTVRRSAGKTHTMLADEGIVPSAAKAIAAVSCGWKRRGWPLVTTCKCDSSVCRCRFDLLGKIGGQGTPRRRLDDGSLFTRYRQTTNLRSRAARWASCDAPLCGRRSTTGRRGRTPWCAWSWTATTVRNSGLSHARRPRWIRKSGSGGYGATRILRRAPPGSVRHQPEPLCL